MNMPIYVINLEGSTKRWEAVEQSADEAGVSLLRVEAVDGRRLDKAQWQDFDASRFLRWHGRTPLGSEYGCYRSHLAALEQIVASGDAYAIVLEDDARFEPRFLQRVQAITALGDQIGIVKLFNHRLTGFISKLETGQGDRLGRCMHGPLGSALGYLVTQKAAQDLLHALNRMQLPYDIALGRYWTYDAPFHTVETPLVRPDRDGTTTTIGTRDVYRATKLPSYRRLGTLQFRAYDYVRGLVGALAGR